MECKTNSIRKVGENMSFVGLHNTREGIIGFADSKATLRFANGVIGEDVQRGKITKIFKNDKFIFVTHGHNEIFSEKNRVNIEDYIAEHLKNGIDYEIFFKSLDEAIQNDKGDYHDGKYAFIIGSKNKNYKYFLLRCFIEYDKRIVFSKKEYGKQVFYGGSEFYCHLYNNQTFYNHIEISKYADMIKNYIETIIDAKDVFSEIEYNDVGKPVNVEIFQ